MMPFQKGLKEALFILMGMALLGLWDTSHAQGVTIIAQSTFDSGAEGWLVKDLPTLSDLGNPPLVLGTFSPTFQASGGNPGGFISMTDPADAPRNFVFSAPAPFLGDQSAAFGGSINFDMKVTGSDGVMYPAVILVGPGTTLYYPAMPPGSAFSTFTVPLLPTGWKVNDWQSGAQPTNAQMQSVLSNLSALYIAGDWLTGIETASLDNVRILGSPLEGQPDLLIKKGDEPDSAFAINDVYQTTPSGDQIEAQAVAPGETATYHVKAENDGDEDTTFVLKAFESEEPGWTVTYKIGATDITDGITSEGFTILTLAPGDSEIITVAMTPDETASGTSKSTTIQAFLDASNTTVRDVVQATTLLGLVVNSTGDDSDAEPGDSVCDTGQTTAEGEPECTLRAAIEQANATEDTITFNIPSLGIPTIQPQSPLPTIADPVVIDATTQPGGGKVVLDGTSAGANTNGLEFTVGDSVVEGLTIKRFKGHGILFAAGGGISNIEVVENGGWGIFVSGGNLFVHSTVGDPFVDSVVKVNDANGMGGIRVEQGAISAERITDASVLEVVGNNGPGIQTLTDFSNALGPVKVLNNQGTGIEIEGDLFLNGSRSLDGSVVDCNRGDGINATGNVTIINGEVCGNGVEDIVAGGKLRLRNVIFGDACTTVCD